VISKVILTFYRNHNVITDKQFGFQCGKSTTQLLSKFTDSIYKNLDSKEHVLVLLIDYSKAFDTLKHDRLIDALNDCGIRGPLNNWCKDYMANRSYVVKIADTVSKKVTVSSGTAQGSVLGPLHYITYVNDAVNLVKNCDMYQFADDTCLVAADKDIDKALKNLQTDFTLLTKWSHDAGLVLNVDKTKLLYISSSQNRSLRKIKLIAHTHQCLHSNNQGCACIPVEIVNHQKYLGLIIDDRMKWNDHIHYVCDRLRAILAKFVIIKNKIPYSTLLQLYKVLGETIINYGISSYGRTFKSHLDHIYKLQLRILKSIVPKKIKIKFKDDECELFRHCDILPVHEQVKLNLLTENYFNKKFQTYKEYTIQTRSASKMLLNIPRHNNHYGKQLLQHQVPTLINHLPMTIKQKISEINIKNTLKKYYLSILQL
jgi:hypothetical protein